jgi:chitinase
MNLSAYHPMMPALGSPLMVRFLGRSPLRAAAGTLWAAGALFAAAGCGNPEFETAPAPTAAAGPTMEADPIAAPTIRPAEGPFRLVGYYASWDVYNRGFFLSQLQGERLTHVNYAFSNIGPAGECVLGDADADTARFFDAAKSVNGEDDPTGGLRGNFRQLTLLKEKYPALKVLISIGGWTWSERFSDVALTEDRRARFAQSCLDLYLVRYGDAFDGVDIDWEYPVRNGLYPGRPEDKHNLTLLLEEFRNQMDALQATTGRRYLLTLAGPSAPGTIDTFELAEIAHTVDWINLMAYDYHVAAEATTGLLAPLYGSARDPDPVSRASYNGDAAVRAYLAAGVPPRQIVLGLPFYGRAWQGAAGDGLFQPAGGPAFGQDEPGYMSYAEIAAGPLKTYRRYWADDAKAPWLHDPATGTFISYEDAESIGWKTGYIRSKGLGGAMVWELGLDGGLLLGPLGDGLFGASDG